MNKPNDYRRTRFCEVLFDVKSHKNELNSKIKSEHPRAINIYNHVRDNSMPYKLDFAKIYCGKCAYCGRSFQTTNLVFFEVDHYINQASDDETVDLDEMVNLVFSCQDCNRSKSGFTIIPRYRETLDPDEEFVKRVFYRDDRFYIRLNQDYMDDKIIFEYYSKMKFAYQFRRLDYLLAALRGRVSSSNDIRVKEILKRTISLLEEKRALISYATCDI